MRTLCILVAALALIAGAWAQAGVIVSDNFNDQSLDLTKWSTWTTSPNDWNVYEEAGATVGPSGLAGYDGGYLRQDPNTPGNEAGDLRACGIRTNLTVDLRYAAVTVVYDGFEQYDVFGMAFAPNANLAHDFVNQLGGSTVPFASMYGQNTSYSPVFSNSTGYAVTDNWGWVGKPYGTSRQSLTITPLGGGIYQLEHTLIANSVNLAEDLAVTTVLSPNDRNVYTTVAIPDADAQAMYFYFFIEDRIGYAPAGQDTRLDNINISQIPEPTSLFALCTLLVSLKLFKRS